MTIRVRKMFMSDIPAVIEMGLAHMTERSPHLVEKFDPEWLEYNLQYGIVNGEKDKIFIRVCLFNEEIVGYIYAYATRFIYADAYEGIVNLVYVKPGRRGGKYALELLKQFDRWACAIPCMELIAGSVITDNEADIARTERFYNKMGYKTVGTLNRRVTYGREIEGSSSS